MLSHDAGRCFAFEIVLPPAPKIARRQYALQPTEGGCLVTEFTVDRRSQLFAPLGGLATGESDRAAANRAHIQTTLARLEERAEASR